MTGIAVQIALRVRLITTPAVTSLVPAGSILDRNARPAPSPSIILGEDQELDGGDLARSQTRIISTLHIWEKAVGLSGVKTIAAAIRAAVHASRLQVAGLHCADCRVSSTRFLRDPDGEHSHGVVTIEILVGEA